MLQNLSNQFLCGAALRGLRAPGQSLRPCELNCLLPEVLAAVGLGVESRVVGASRPCPWAVTWEDRESPAPGGCAACPAEEEC